MSFLNNQVSCHGTYEIRNYPVVLALTRRSEANSDILNTVALQAAERPISHFSHEGRQTFVTFIRTIYLIKNVTRNHLNKFY